jgi:hypothetical protein
MWWCRLDAGDPLMAGRPFVEVPAPPVANPLDAWGGWDGKGWGPGQSLFVGSGTRAGGDSEIYRLDGPGAAWQNDGAPKSPEQAETINKIRDGIDPGDGQPRLYAYFERPQGGQTWLISRPLGGGWDFEGVLSAELSVGGRGVGIDPNDLSIVYAGSSNAPGEDIATVSHKSGGGWEEIRSVEGALMWELEFDEHGRLWEFYNNFGKEELVSAVFVNGEDTGPSYGGDISSANWFPTSGHMYTVGALSQEHSQDLRNTIARSANGGEWEVVHAFETAGMGDHVLTIPREPLELWAVGHDPFEVAYTLDGTTWVREVSIPSFPTGTDTNHLSAIAFYQDAVWVFARDETTGRTRAFTDGGAQDVMVQVV